MKKNFLNVKTGLLAAAAVALIVAGGIGGTRAVLTQSQTYSGKLQTDKINVKVEDGGSEGTLLESLQKEVGIMTPGKHYAETITVENPDGMDEYVRVILTKRWTDKDKGTIANTALTPDLIHMKFSDGWYVDTKTQNIEESTEQLVLYYTKPLAKGEKVELTSEIWLDSKVATIAAEKDGELDFSYGNVNIFLDAEANGVQTNSAQAAIASAWGIDVTVSGDTISGGTLSAATTW